MAHSVKQNALPSEMITCQGSIPSLSLDQWSRVDINKVCIAVYTDDYCFIVKAVCKSKIDVAMVIFKLVFVASNCYYEHFRILSAVYIHSLLVMCISNC